MDLLKEHNIKYTASVKQANLIFHPYSQPLYLSKTGLTELVDLARLLVIFGKAAHVRHQQAPADGAHISWTKNTNGNYLVHLCGGIGMHNWHLTLNSVETDFDDGGQHIWRAFGLGPGQTRPTAQALAKVRLLVHQSTRLTPVGPVDVLASYAKKIPKSTKSMPKAMAYLAQARAMVQVDAIKRRVASINEGIGNIRRVLDDTNKQMATLRSDEGRLRSIFALANKSGLDLPSDNGNILVRYHDTLSEVQGYNTSYKSELANNESQLVLETKNLATAMQKINKVSNSVIATQIAALANAKKHGHILFYGANRMGKRLFVGIPAVMGTSAGCQIRDGCGCVERPTLSDTGRLVLEFHNTAECGHAGGGCMGVAIEPVDIQRNLWGHMHTKVGCELQCWADYAPDLVNYIERGRFCEAVKLTQDYLSKLNLHSPLCNNSGVNNSSYAATLINTDGRRVHQNLIDSLTGVCRVEFGAGRPAGRRPVADAIAAGTTGQPLF